MYQVANLSTTTTVNRISVAEQRVVFHHLNWQSYEQILQALNHGRSSRLSYDQGTLEITMPSEKHEFAIRLIELFIRILVMELGLKIKTMGSTTLSFPQLNRSAEPDSGFYIQNQSKVAGKDIDLTCDPPPDLVVEVDITHTDINKLSLYASMGVPEFWRYNGQRWQIYHLVEEQYVEVEHSPTFPWVEKENLYQFLADSRDDEIATEKSFRAWVQKRINSLPRGKW